MTRTLLVAAVTAFLLPGLSPGQQPTEEINRDKMLATPQWQDKYDKYNPPSDLLESLKPKLGADTKIDVYLGLWCPDSRNNVPPFIKILDRAGSEAPVRYVAVPRKASKDVKYYVEAMKIEKVPTFIFYRNGQEIGRIIERPKTGMIEDMADILLK